MRFNLPKEVKKVAAGVAAMTVAGAASAGELAAAATGGMDKAELTLIGVAVLAVCGLIFLIKSGKRTAT